MQNSRLVIFDKVPFENSYENVINFPNVQELKDFMTYSKDLFNIIYDKSEMNYVKEHERQINISGKSEEYKNACYLFYENENTTMFAFVVGYDYINKGTLTGTTTLHYEIDVWNTYQFQLKKSTAKGFIEQQTVKNFKTMENIGTGEQYTMPNIIDRSQNFNTGTKLLREFQRVDIVVHWLVVVAKTSIIVKKGYNDNSSSNVGTYKNMKYFIIPVNEQCTQSYNFVYNGKTYKSDSVTTVINKLTNQFDKDGANTVNQTVYNYTSKYIGIDYEFENNTVTIKNENDVIANIINLTGSENSENGGSGSGGGTGGNVTGDYNKGELTNANYKLSQDNVNRLINGFRKVNVKVDYSFVIAQLFVESHWGNTGSGTVAEVDNNWSGITAPLYVPDKYNCHFSTGMPRPSNEGGNYVHFDSLDDFFIGYAYVLSLENGNYEVENKTTIDDYCRGLFTENASYASVGYDYYTNTLMKPTYNAIVDANPEQIKQIKELSPKL